MQIDWVHSLISPSSSLEALTESLDTYGTYRSYEYGGETTTWVVEVWKLELKSPDARIPALYDLQAAKL